MKQYKRFINYNLKKMKVFLGCFMILFLISGCELSKESDVMLEIKEVTLTADKNEIYSNGEDFAVIYVVLKTEDGKEVKNDDVIVYANGTELESNQFSTNTSGKYIIKAVHNGIFSNEVTIVASPEVEYSFADLEGTWSLSLGGVSQGTFMVDANGLVTLKPAGTYNKYIGNMFPGIFTINIDGVINGKQEHKDSYTTDIYTYNGQLNAQKKQIIGTLNCYQKDAARYGGSESNTSYNMVMEKID